LITAKWPPGRTRVLYVSPLKALNNDVRRNLLRPLAELEKLFAGAQTPFPVIGVATRSGDTPPSERRRMQRNPPEILITTPESLNLLLSSHGGRTLLTGIATVILDEIHAVVNGKRGVHLITAVDRLVRLSGEFQRIALSATIRPLETVAEFVGGYVMEGSLHSPRYVPRRVRIVKSAQNKDYRLSVRFPQAAVGWNDRDSFWQPFVAEIKRVVEGNRSTLIFTNSRRLCEKITHLINQGEPAPVAYAHHGSLSREIRSEVERKFKSGELRAIVATSSLELGIDIGALDEVVLIQSAPSVSAAIQRIGRAGHRVGEISRGTLLPIEPRDIMESAVLAGGISFQDIEAVRPVQSPLDLLAQIIVSMVGLETRDIDELHARLRTSYPYRTLSRRQFDLVLNMLAGRYAGSRVRELKPRIAIDRLANSARAARGVLQDLYFSGGTIPDRGYFHLRHQQNGARIGELDEEFVWEARIGQAFTLGTQTWKIERITHNDVFVSPARPGAAVPPFWKAEERLREFHLSKRIGRFLETADSRLNEPQFKDYLEKYHCLDPVAAEQLTFFLQRQKEETGCPLPHRRHLLIEHVRTGPGGYPGNQIVVHTVWGGRVNRPFAMALEAAWEERFGFRPEIFPSNDCILLQLPHDVGGDEIVSLVRSSAVPDLLKKKLEGSGFFGARFRECAGRALLLTRRKMNERIPLWLSRLRSQKLLESVLSFEDFPILLETWRTCLKDEFDLDALAAVLGELESGAVTWSETQTAHPSPLAQSASWPQVNRYMYMDDEPRSGKSSRLRGDLISEVVLSSEMRPAVPAELAGQFELKRQRLAPGYSPDGARDLIEWMKERLLVPLSEWQILLTAVQSDHDLDCKALIEAVAHRLAVLKVPGAAEPLIAALEELPRIVFGFYGSVKAVDVENLVAGKPLVDVRLEDPELADEDPDAVCSSLLSQWLQYYSPKTMAFIGSALGLDRGRLEAAVEGLVGAERLLVGQLLQEPGGETICDRENFEILVRLMRAQARPTFEPLGLDRLPLFLATLQGIAEPASDLEGLFARIEQLICRPAPAELWERDIFPARMATYDSSWLDSIMQQGDLCWVGGENRRVCFCFETDLDLLQVEPAGSGSAVRLPAETKPVESDTQPAGEKVNTALWPDPLARYDFSALVRRTGLPPAELNQKIWDAVWRGEVTNDTMAALRNGIENGFQLSGPSPKVAPTRNRRGRPGGRAAFARWKGSRPLAGNWLRIAWPEPEDDLLDREERNKDRARLLLDRYGIVFRELLANEPQPFGWSSIFRALRLMELSGEVLTGYFFDGVPGPQFISHRAFRLLQAPLHQEAIYWMAATDPASLCGMRLDALKSKLPRRTTGNHLVYHGSRVVLESRRRGKTLVFYVPEGDPHVQSYLGLFHHMLNRKFQPVRRIVVEQINGVDAAHSPYAEIFRIGFDVNVDFKKLILFRKYRP
jgi:ATP-dependent Lhr-like helicase